ncbi:putative retrovirus-related pol polyprotein from transposon opus [Trichonephila clavipes]|nr:putative retrovirus-related pol polyprotein from transposon opus [Trichonephila clavipes]
MTLSEQARKLESAEANAASYMGISFPDSIIKPDPKRLKPLSDMSVLKDSSTLQRALGIVETDLSSFMIGATLSRTGRPVAFFSRALHVSELRHLSPEKEAHAIVESLRHWRYFLMEKHFEVFADQQAVAFAFNQSGIEANSEYAHVKLDDARQTTVSMRYLAPRGKTTRSDGIKDAEENVQVHPDLKSTKNSDSTITLEDSIEQNINTLALRTARHRQPPAYLKDYIRD